MIESLIKDSCRNVTYENDGIWRAVGEAKIHYPDGAHSANFPGEDTSFWFEHRKNCLLALVRRLPPGGPIFDIGGGNGYLAFALQQNGWPTVLVEPHETGVLNARQRGQKFIIHSDFDGLNFTPDTLPAVGLFDVLEHIEDDLGKLRSLRKAIKTGGRIYLTVPACPILWSTEDVAAGHFRRYSQNAIVQLLEKAGFTVEYSTYIFSLFPAPLFLLRALPSKLGLRKPLHKDFYGKEVFRPTESLNPVVRKVLSYEISAVSAGRTLPLGTSCLLCARA